MKRTEEGVWAASNRASTWFAMAFISTVVGIPLFAAPPPGGTAPITVPAGGFAIDGNLIANSPIDGVGDWIVSPDYPGSGAAVLAPDGTVLDPGKTFHIIDPWGNSGGDIIFGGGLKWTDDPNTWTWTEGKPSSKTEINNVLMHVTTDASDQIWMAVAADRASTSGDSYIDFEFLQNPLVRTNNGKFVSYGPHGGRTVNDLLLSLAFTGGGKVADFLAYRWLPDGNGGYAYVDVTTALPPGGVFVGLNTGSIAVPYGAFGKTTYAANAFAEAIVNMTALLAGFDPCASIGFKTIMVKTKASASNTASIEDCIDPVQYNLRIGPVADAGPDQVLCDAGDNTVFEVHGTATGGLRPVKTVLWEAINGSAVIANPNTLSTAVNVASDAVTLRFTATQENGCTAVDEVVLRVKPLPVAEITGPETVCPATRVTFQAPAGMTAYAWSVSGNAAIDGVANARQVAVVSGGQCGGTFTLSLSVSSNGCSATAMANVIVNDVLPPKLTVPANRVLECPADGDTNVTGVATAVDECGAANVTYSDAITNGCGGSRVIARTWTATDRCGNIASAAQMIFIRDLTPPAITVPPDRVLECPASPTTDITGTAVAQDACSRVAITFKDSISNPCGGSKIVTRTWTATDECGNVASAVQTITVRDTTPPVLSLPPSLVLECPANTSTNATGVASATDDCSAVVVTCVESATNTCGSGQVISRNWIATDECGNTASGLQTITVRDTTRPTLTVPADLVLECPADTGTNATGVATGSDTCGLARITFSDVVTNICGGSRMVYRTWTAADDCGNAISATQIITVRDTTRPELILPPNLVLECPAETGTNATGMAFGSDACGAVQIRFSDVVTNGCGGTRTVFRTWTISDECGNTTNGMQTIIVRDTINPALVVPPDLVLECPADPGTNLTGTATATDGCSVPALRFNDSVAVICGNSKLITRTWIATDACGNTSSSAQKITVQDTRAPSLTLPADITLECGANTAPASAGTAVAQDTCNGATIRYADSVTNICGGSKLIRRTWTATDTCGNTTNGVQTITVRDTTPPVLQLPANLVIECPGDTRTNATGVPMVSDGCGSVAVSYNDIITTNCGITRIVQRLWTAIDQCGNTTNGLQTIIVQDTRKPTIVCPAIKVECVGDVPAAYTSLAAFQAAGGTAADTCDSALTFSLISDSGLVGSCPGKVTRVYRVSDDCGNFAEGTQTIVVDDTIPPVVICPPTVTLECTNSLDPADIGRATATDNCDSDPAITYSDAVVPSQYLIKWYAADPDAGHAPYQPTYLKLSPASLACPDAARLTGRAADPLRNAVAYGPTSSTLDALTSLGAEPIALGQIVPFEAVIEVSGGSTRPEKGTIEFTTTWSTHTTSNDGFGYDTNYMVYCAFVDIADPGLLDPHNNARVESFSSKLVGAGTVNEQIQGTFRVSGLDSGDKVVVEIWVVLMDRTPRNFGGTIASDLVSAQKALTPPEPISTGNQTVSIGNLSKLGTLPAPQEQPPLPPVPPQPTPLPGYLVSVIDRTWRATDDCGNQDTCVQRITLRDTTPPTITAPPSIVLDCTADYGTNVTGGAVAIDACGEVILTYSDVITNACGSAGSVVRTWTASDGYNITSSVQVITMRDATPPTITCAGDRTVMAAQTWTFDEPTAVDTCGAALVSVLSTVTNQSQADRMVVTRTWRAADVCGNVATCQQSITVVMPAPLIAPTITTHPECQVAGLGGSASLTVEAIGSGPLSYQWQFNGVNLPGATTSSLSLENLLFANAGLYTVIVSNGAGTARSPAAVINVAPILQNSYVNHELKLTWPAGYILQSAPTPFGPYVDEPGATSPYVQIDLVDPQKYFRLRADALSLAIAFLPNGQTSINVSGAPGMNLIIQASANLIDWVNISTNTAPAQVVDPGAGQGPLRFYRAVPYCIEAGMRMEQQPPVIVSQSASQTAGLGADLTLSVTAQSAGICGFQWQRNGVTIPGATGSSLALQDLGFSDAGVYSVLAGNWDGTAVGAPIVVDVAARLLSDMVDGRLILSWPSSFALQSAWSPLGPFADVPGASSPYQPDLSGAPMQFYRLRSVPPTLSTLRLTNGEVSVTLHGSPGINYVIQGTYNFVDWTSLHTGAAPCTYLDSESSEAGARYYRAVPASVVLAAPGSN